MATAVDTAGAARLIADGAQLVDVLPVEIYRQEHIAGAVNIPVAELAAAPDRLDPSKPVVVYCYDYQ